MGGEHADRRPDPEPAAPSGGNEATGTTDSDGETGIVAGGPMNSRHRAGPAVEVDDDAPTEAFALPNSSATRSRRRLLVVAIVCGLVVAAGLVLVGLGFHGGDPELVDAARPVTAAPTVSSVAVVPATPPAATTTPPTASNPCASAAAFREVLEQTSPGFSARRNLTSYRLEGCSRGIALAQGSKPESDSTYVALLPQSGGRYRVEPWPAGTECTEIGTTLPKALAGKFCATPEPAAPSPQGTGTAGGAVGRCAPDLPTCPAGYQEGVVSKANPYGCDFNAISADNPCQYRLTAEGKHNPTTPASRWAACHLNGIREFC
ncbi:hypothetical protein [Actinomycetospora sp. CA-084318]|uniref:hypothetical protein n=1 Tax=Actinomycetospora sp. CA-084318 TaxID=3239892 RepID=UPI003D970035